MIGKSAILPTIFFILATHFTGCSGTGVDSGSSQGGGNLTGNTAPVADAGPIQNVKSGTLVTLNGSNSTDVNGDLLTYLWSFVSVPGESSATLSNPTVVAPSFTADVVGEYVLQLVVNDEHSDSIPATVTVSVSEGNIRPTANAGDDKNVDEGIVVSLDGKKSTDANGDPLTYTWSIIEKPTVPTQSKAILSNTKIVNPTFLADQPGDYVIGLQVSDRTLFSTMDTVKIKANGAPTSIPSPCNLTSPCRHFVVFTIDPFPTVALDGSLSTDPNKDPLTYQWNVKDPNGVVVALSEDGKKSQSSFTPTVTGTYMGQLQVSDGRLTDVKPIEVIVTDKPTASISPEEDSILVNHEIELTGGSINVDENGFTWTVVSKPDGSAVSIPPTEKTATLRFTPDLPGPYKIQLRVNRGSLPSDNTAEAVIRAKTVLAGQDRETSVCTDIQLNATTSDGSGTLTWSVSKSNTPVNLNPNGSSFFADETASYVATVKNNAGGEFETDEMTITVDALDRDSNTSSNKGTIGHRMYHYGPDDSDDGNGQKCDNRFDGGSYCPLDCEECHRAGTHDTSHLFGGYDLSVEARRNATGIEKRLTGFDPHTGGKYTGDTKALGCRIKQLVNFLGNPTSVPSGGH